MKIKRMPWWAKILFRASEPHGLSLGTTVYLCNRLYDEYTLQTPPSTEAEAVLAHEIEHLVRFEKMGWHKIIKYWLNKEFRLSEEIAAVTKEVAVYRRRRTEFDIEGRARIWSSKKYLNMTTYESALKILRNL